MYILSLITIQIKAYFVFEFNFDRSRKEILIIFMIMLSPTRTSCSSEIIPLKKIEYLNFFHGKKKFLEEYCHQKFKKNSMSRRINRLL